MSRVSMQKMYFIAKKPKCILKNGEENDYEESKNENFILESNQIPDEGH